MLTFEQTPNYEENEARTESNPAVTPCAICGKGIEKVKVRYWVRLYLGNTAIKPEDVQSITPEEFDAGDLGVHAIGEKCFKANPGLQDYVNLSWDF